MERPQYDEWIGVTPFTSIGAKYEIELNICTGSLRHRPFMFDMSKRRNMEWISGEPPRSEKEKQNG